MEWRGCGSRFCCGVWGEAEEGEGGLSLENAGFGLVDCAGGIELWLTRYVVVLSPLQC